MREKKDEAAKKDEGSVGDRYEVVLTGRSPLLMHHDDIDHADRVSAERDRIKKESKKDKTAAFKAGDDRCPAGTWKGYLYSDGEKVAIPVGNLRTCLMKAGAKMSLGNKNETFKKLVPGGILFEDDFSEFLYGGGAPLSMAQVEAIDGTFSEQAALAAGMGFKLMVKRAAVTNKKHVRVRPMFKNWQVRTTILINDALFGPASLQELWNTAGRRIGLGDWRPDSPTSPGPYGVFGASLSKL